MNDTREEQLLNAGKAADAEKRTDVESLKKKYAASDEKVYTVVTTVQVDDETEDEFTFLFKKPKAASYDRYVKTMSNSVTKASKSFAFDNIIDEQSIRQSLSALQISFSVCLDWQTLHQ